MSQITITDTAKNWEILNPILDNKTIGIVHETGEMKIGDGINRWSQLSFRQMVAPYTIIVKDQDTGMDFRIVVRNSQLIFDKELTSLGFNGVEGQDWMNISGIL
jgi:hypothetical protein